MGQSTCEGGVIIDLSSLQKIELSVDKRSVRVGAGVRCGTLEYTLSDAGVVVPLACNPMVGISGLTLGGGPPLFDGIRPTKLSQLTAITKEVSNFIAANSKVDTDSPKQSDGHYMHGAPCTVNPQAIPIRSQTFLRKLVCEVRANGGDLSNNNVSVH